MLLHGTHEWYAARLGRFTGYNIHSLLSDGKKAGSFGEGFYTLCFEKAVEIVFGIDEEWDALKYNWDVKRGTELEPYAFEFYQSLKARQFINVEKAYFFPYGDNSGSTPDGLVGKNGTLQIKCPRPEKIFKLIAEGKDAIDPKYISQMNLEMLSTRSDHACFFNYAIWNGEPIYHEIIIEPDKSIQNKIDDRIGHGVEQRDKYVKMLKNKKQF